MSTAKQWAAIRGEWSCYGRRFRISHEARECARCGEERMCIVVDVSNQEYCDVPLCAPCLAELAAEVADEACEIDQRVKDLWEDEEAGRLG